MTHKEFWDERIIKQLNDDRKNSIRLAFDDLLRVKEGRDAYLRNALANRDQYFKDLEAQSQKNEAAFKVECQKELDSQLKDLGEIAQPREIPQDATPEQKQRLENYNALVKDATAKFEPVFLDTSPRALVNKALGGLLIPAMKDIIALKDGEISEWKGKFDELQKKWNASLKAANTSQRQSVQQQAQPLSGVQFDRNDGRRMEQLLQNLPA
jgi:hypothetical protein